jgi:hypothetical protein
LKIPTGEVSSTNPIEENRRLSQNMAGLNKLLSPLTKILVAIVHLREPGLVLGKRDLELVNCARSPRASREEWRWLGQGTDGHDVRFLLDLSGKETHSAGHLVDATYFAHEGPLERVHARVELYENQQKLW